MNVANPSRSCTTTCASASCFARAPSSACRAGFFGVGDFFARSARVAALIAGADTCGNATLLCSLPSTTGIFTRAIATGSVPSSLPYFASRNPISASRLLVPYCASSSGVA